MLPVKLDDLIHARTVESVRVDFKATWNPRFRDWKPRRPAGH